jgi:hypothetical protein
MLASGGQPRVPNRRHERIVLDPSALPEVSGLDGSRNLDDAALLGLLARSALLDA